MATASKQHLNCIKFLSIKYYQCCSKPHMKMPQWSVCSRTAAVLCQHCTHRGTITKEDSLYPHWHTAIYHTAVCVMSACCHFITRRLAGVNKDLVVFSDAVCCSLASYHTQISCFFLHVQVTSKSCGVKSTMLPSGL